VLETFVSYKLGQSLHPNEAKNMANLTLRQQPPNRPRQPPRVMMRGVVRQHQRLERASQQKEGLIVKRGRNQGAWPF